VTCSRKQEELDKALQDWQGQGLDVQVSTCDLSGNFCCSLQQSFATNAEVLDACSQWQ